MQATSAAHRNPFDFTTLTILNPYIHHVAPRYVPIHLIPLFPLFFPVYVF
jgi:hypothetical protein